jgi:hypothetical protein
MEMVKKFDVLSFQNEFQFLQFLNLNDGKVAEEWVEEFGKLHN